MPDTEKQRKHELECMRLASDLKEMARNTLNPDLEAHCLRMAEAWIEQTTLDPGKDTALS